MVNFAVTKDRLTTRNSRSRRSLPNSVDSQLRILRMRSAESLASHGLPNFASSVKYSVADLEQLAALWSDSSWTNSALRSLRTAACEPAAAPANHICDNFSAAGNALQLFKRPDPPHWVKVLCEYRDALQGLVLIPEVADGAVALRFLYASQNPRCAVFQKLVLVMSSKPELPVNEDGWPDLFQYVDAHVPWTFQLVPCQYSNHLQLPQMDANKVYVLQDSLYAEHSQLHCFGALQRFDDLLRFYTHHHWHSSEPKTKKAKQQSSAGLEAEADAHPWLRHYLQESGRQRTSQATSSSSTHSRTPRPEVTPTPEEDVAALWSSLAEVRAEWSAVNLWQGHDFRLTLRGGQWTAEHRGCVTDAVAAQSGQ